MPTSHSGSDSSSSGLGDRSPNPAPGAQGDDQCDILWSNQPTRASIPKEDIQILVQEMGLRHSQEGGGRGSGSNKDRSNESRNAIK